MRMEGCGQGGKGKHTGVLRRAASRGLYWEPLLQRRSSPIGHRSSVSSGHPHTQRRLLPPQSTGEAGEQGNNARAREVDAEARRGPQWRAALRERLRSSSSEGCGGLAKRSLVVGGRGREQKDHTTVRPHQLSRAHTHSSLQLWPAFPLRQRTPPPGIHGRHARVRPRISDCISMAMCSVPEACSLLSPLRSRRRYAMRPWDVETAGDCRDQDTRTLGHDETAAHPG